MNSFTLTAVGNLARNPELVSKGERTYTKLCLVGNDYAGKDEEGAAKEVVTSLWFVAFGPVAELIAQHARKGDQLILEAKVRESNWTDGLKDALTRLRKFGGRCVLGFQSVAQVSSTYGSGEAQTTIENCGNTLILRCSASEHGGTSQFASRLIGEREVVHRQTSRGRDHEGWFAGRGQRRSTSVSEQRITEPAVMASELEQLPDLTGYLKTASSAEWLRVSFRP